MGKKLESLLAYNMADTLFIATYKYKYDNSPGLFSKVELPIWYIAFSAFTNILSPDIQAMLYLNNYNNLLATETFRDENYPENIFYKQDYDIKYDIDNYPISIDSASIVY